MKIKKFKKYNAYYIKFLDHTHGVKHTVNVEVIGWCLEDHDEHVVLSAWRVDHHDTDMVENNYEPFTIVKSCIKRTKLLNGI